MTFVWTGLDEIRSLILSRTLRFKPFQSIYRSRVNRTLFLFFLSMGLNAIFLSINPQILFTLTPLILGVPHLISSFHYSSENLKTNRWQVWAVFLIWILTFLSQDWLHPAWLAGISLMACALVFQVSFGLTILGIIFLYFAPMNALVFLLIAHNFFAFVPWYQNTKNRNEKNAILVTLFGLILCILLLTLGLNEYKLHHLTQTDWPPSGAKIQLYNNKQQSIKPGSLLNCRAA